MDRDPLSDSESYTSDFTYTAIMDNPSGGMTARFMSQASTSDDDQDMEEDSSDMDAGECEKKRVEYIDDLTDLEKQFAILREQ